MAKVVAAKVVAVALGEFEEQATSWRMGRCIDTSAYDTRSSLW